MTAYHQLRPTTTTPVEDVWREFSGELRRFILRRVSDPQDADDILQLVAVRLVQHSDEPRDRRTLLAWLYTVTRNAITDHYRAAVHRRELATADVPDSPAIDLSGDPSADLDARQALAELAACIPPLLRLLPPDQAAAVELVDLHSVSQVEAARTSGVSVSGMKSRVQRGRRALRDAITACCHVELDVRGRVQEFEPHAEPHVEPQLEAQRGPGCACAA